MPALPHVLARLGSHAAAPAPRLTLDTAACAAVFERARATDLLILCCKSYAGWLQHWSCGRSDAFGVC